MAELLLTHEEMSPERVDYEFALLANQYGALALSHEVILGDPDDDTPRKPQEDDRGSEESPEEDEGDHGTRPPFVSGAQMRGGGYPVPHETGDTTFPWERPTTPIPPYTPEPEPESDPAPAPEEEKPSEE